MNRLITFAAGVVTGVFIDQTYRVPNISKVGTSLGSAFAKKVQDLEKKGGDEGRKNKNENDSFWRRK